MVVKGNQPTLLAEIQEYFERVQARATALHNTLNPAACLKSQRVRIVGDDGPGLTVGRDRTFEKGHGRLETRDLQVLPVPPEIDWPAAEQVIRLERHTKESKSGKDRMETVYCITSVSPQEASPDQLQNLCRGHWGIENRSHWVRDVTYDEDRSTVRTGNIPQVMAALRNTMIGLMRLLGHTKIAANCRSYSYDSKRTLPILLNPPTFE